MLYKLTRSPYRNVSTNAVFVYRPCQTCQSYYYSVTVKLKIIPEVIARMCRKSFGTDFRFDIPDFRKIFLVGYVKLFRHDVPFERRTCTMEFTKYTDRIGTESRQKL